MQGEHLRLYGFSLALLVIVGFSYYGKDNSYPYLIEGEQSDTPDLIASNAFDINANKSIIELNNTKR